MSLPVAQSKIIKPSQTLCQWRSQRSLSTHRLFASGAVTDRKIITVSRLCKWRSQRASSRHRDLASGAVKDHQAVTVFLSVAQSNITKPIQCFCQWRQWRSQISPSRHSVFANGASGAVRDRQAVTVFLPVAQSNITKPSQCP